ncbi:TetR/AcrR family transcriptional regulator [Desulfuromonas sp. TF]|uniref:TetR/AcrR family transcriptional regulator n=1 Tax=Desulfuromonas sp. TF TaxID=1232410 RepID=UPI0003FD45A6|nr:TetR/AcrR family transcriptional regulator [Desulfuromonas sp. TF]
MPAKGEKTKEKITRAAAELFRRQGFAATSISDLVEAAGVKKGSLYFHFPGKDDLALEVLRQAEEEFMAFLDAALTGPTPAERLDNFFLKALKFHRGSGFVGGCLFGNTALEASDCNPLYACRVAEVFDRWTGKIASVIADAQYAGEIRSDLPADVLAQFAVSSVEGGIMLARLRKEEEPLSRCLDSLRTLLELKLEKKNGHAAN